MFPQQLGTFTLVPPLSGEKKKKKWLRADEAVRGGKKSDITPATIVSALNFIFAASFWWQLASQPQLQCQLQKKKKRVCSASRTVTVAGCRRT
jgi:hypothetical protein